MYSQVAVGFIFNSEQLLYFLTDIHSARLPLIKEIASHDLIPDSEWHYVWGLLADELWCLHAPHVLLAILLPDLKKTIPPFAVNPINTRSPPSHVLMI